MSYSEEQINYVPAPLRVFLLLISSDDLDAPLVLLAGVARGEAVFCRTDLLVVTSPTDSLLDTEVPRNLSFPTVTAAAVATAATAAVVAVVVVIVVNVGVVVIVVVAIVDVIVIAVVVVVIVIVVVDIDVVIVIVTVAVLGCLVVNKRLSLCTLLLALKFDILLKLI